MSDQIDASAAEKQALETLFRLTEERVEGVHGYNNPAEVRLEAAKELLQYAARAKHGPLSHSSYSRNE